MAFTWKTTDIWKGEGIYHLTFVVAERRPLLGVLVALDDVTRPDVPDYADKLEGDDRDVLKLRPGITGPATLKYRLEDEMIADFVKEVRCLDYCRFCEKFVDASRALNNDLFNQLRELPDQEIAVWYNDNVIYPDKVRLNCYYYRNYSFLKDIEMIFATVLGRKMTYAGEEI